MPSNNNPLGIATPHPFLGLMGGLALAPLPRMIGPGVVHRPIAPPAAFIPPAVITDLLARTIPDCRAERDQTSDSAALTHAALLLDESQSMNKHRSAALEGFNTQVEAVREGAKEAGKTLVSLNVFSSSPRAVLTAAPAEELKPMDADEYVPGGCTALYDALGDTIASLLAQPGASDPKTAFLVAAFTDGKENASRRYTGALLKELIVRLEATGRWTFTLMGPKGGADELASVLSMATGNVASFDPANTESVQDAFATMAAASTNYMTMRSAGITGSASLYADLGRHHD